MRYTEGLKNMVYKRFTILLIIRVTILLTNMVFLSIVIIKPERLFTSILLLLILALLLYDFIHFINKTNRELSRFLNAVKQNDFTAKFPDNKLGQSFQGLNQSFSNILSFLNKSQLEKEAQVQYLKLIMNSVSIGMIIFDTSGKIELLNKASLDLLSVHSLGHIDNLKRINEKLAEEINELKPGKTKLIEIDINQEKLQLSVNRKNIKILGNELGLLSFQNINNEIEQKEIKAWQNLFRTLAHEIMNSVTPISSLTETGIEILENNNGKRKSIVDLNDDQIVKVQTILKTVNKRNNRLHNFINEYRKLLKIPSPNLTVLLLSGFLNDIKCLVEEELKKNNIKLKIIEKDQDLSIIGDPVLLEQVMLNMIQNSIDALQKTKIPKLTIEIFQKSEKMYITIKDNGKGISPDKIDKIFIPFFTTKETGSGIGLSLSKQIMKSHNGTISVSSVPNKLTEFKLIFQ